MHWIRTEYENKLDGLKRRTKETDEYIEGIEDQLEYLENQSRRNNVKIMGVDEDLEEKTWDDTEKIVRKLIHEKLNFEEDIAIERAHRVGKKQRQSTSRPDGSKVNDRPRPIIVKFTRWKQKEEILRAARQKKPMGLVFYPDLAKRTLQRRAEDIPRLVAERKKGKIAYFIMDKLVVRDKPPDRPGDRSDDHDDEVFINVSGRNRR